MATQQVRDVLTQTIEQLSDAEQALTPEQMVDALLASPAIQALQADAWQQGYSAGVRFARSHG